MQNCHLQQIHNSVEFILFSPYFPPKNKTHIKKVQHLTNKLSQSSFALLGNFIQEFGSQFTVLSDLSFLLHTHTHTHPSTHTAMRKPSISHGIHFILAVTAAGTVPARSSWAGTMIGWVPFSEIGLVVIDLPSNLSKQQQHRSPI